MEFHQEGLHILIKAYANGWSYVTDQFIPIWKGYLLYQGRLLCEAEDYKKEVCLAKLKEKCREAWEQEAQELKRKQAMSLECFDTWEQS